MPSLKIITLQELKDMEKKEYTSLNILSDIEHECDKDLENDKRYQRGRWSMLVDLIEKLEDDNE